MSLNTNFRTFQKLSLNIISRFVLSSPIEIAFVYNELFVIILHLKSFLSPRSSIQTQVPGNICAMLYGVLSAYQDKYLYLFEQDLGLFWFKKYLYLVWFDLARIDIWFSKCLYLFEQDLQSFTKYLRLTLVFMWNSALREEYNFYFSRAFC